MNMLPQVTLAVTLLCTLLCGCVAEVTIEGVQRENEYLRGKMADVWAENERLRARLRAHPIKNSAETVVDMLDDTELDEQLAVHVETVPGWKPSKATTRAPAKATTRAPAKATTRAPAKATTRAPAKATTRAPAKATTRAPAKATTRAPAKATTRAPRDAPLSWCPKFAKASKSCIRAEGGGYYGGLEKSLLKENVFSAYSAAGQVKNCFEGRKIHGSWKWVEHPGCKWDKNTQCTDHCKGDCMTEKRVIGKDCVPHEAAMVNIRNHYVRMCDSAPDCSNTTFKDPRAGGRRICAFGHPLWGGGLWVNPKTGRREKWTHSLTRAPPCDKKGDPQWYFHTGDSVKCPCHGENGKRLTNQEALYNILGQLGQVGIPPLTAAQVATGTSKGAGWNIMSGYSTYLMLGCWKKKCAPQRLSAEELLDLQWGGGSEC